jgi:hypothetical protein
MARAAVQRDARDWRCHVAAAGENRFQQMPGAAPSAKSEAGMIDRRRFIPRNGSKGIGARKAIHIAVVGTRGRATFSADVDYRRSGPPVVFFTLYLLNSCRWA